MPSIRPPPRLALLDPDVGDVMCKPESCSSILAITLCSAPAVPTDDSHDLGGLLVFVFFSIVAEIDEEAFPLTVFYTCAALARVHASGPPGGV